MTTTLQVLKTDDLWKRLEAFSIDEGTPQFGFAQRLARENGWTPRFALRVVHEYRRFLCLAVTVEHPVTPSDQVDQAWHLHMTYTRSYWDHLCAKVLRRPLHHEPTRGGESEDCKFESWYAKTKASYELAFGERPPADIWPDGAVRFSPAQQWQRVDLSKFRLVHRRSAESLAAALSALAATGAVAGCTPYLLGTSGPHDPAMTTLTVAAVVVILALASVIMSRSGPRSGSRRCGDGCGASGDGTSWFAAGPEANDASAGHHGHGSPSHYGGGDSHSGVYGHGHGESSGHGDDGGGSHGCS